MKLAVRSETTVDTQHICGGQAKRGNQPNGAPVPETHTKSQVETGLTQFLCFQLMTRTDLFMLLRNIRTFCQ